MWKWHVERFWFVWNLLWFPFRQPVLRWVMLILVIAGIITGFVMEGH